jgi:transposase
MIKIDYPNRIRESESELRSRYKTLTSSKRQERCEILLWLKSGKVLTMKEAVSLKGRSTDYGNKLWKRYKNLGLEVNYNPQKSPLEGKQELEDQLASEGFSTIKEAQGWILETYGIKYTENGLGNYFRQRKIKLKTGRPFHPKQNEEKCSAYKKNIKKV